LGLRRRHLNNDKFTVKGSSFSSNMSELHTASLGGQVSKNFFDMVMDTEIVLENESQLWFLDEEEDEECVKVRNLNKNLTPESPLCDCCVDPKSKPLLNFIVLCTD